MLTLFFSPCVALLLFSYMGFMKKIKGKNYSSIFDVGAQIPEKILMENEVLLQFYDIAAGKN